MTRVWRTAWAAPSPNELDLDVRDVHEREQQRASDDRRADPEVAGPRAQRESAEEELLADRRDDRRAEGDRERLERRTRRRQDLRWRHVEQAPEHATQHEDAQRRRQHDRDGHAGVMMHSSVACEPARSLPRTIATGAASHGFCAAFQSVARRDHPHGVGHHRSAGLSLPRALRHPALRFGQTAAWRDQAAGHGQPLRRHERAISEHIRIGIATVDQLKQTGDRLHSRKLRAFHELLPFR